MVFNIAGISILELTTILGLYTLELCHNDFHRLSDNICQNV
jgi:hypothetical protein